jgi:peptidyl-prolyl cis-trans isomerase D
MLQSIRDKTSGWIAYLIIGLISIPFALWGINSYLGGGQQQPAAVVDGDEISVSQLNAAYARYRDRLRQVFGGTLPAAFDNELMLKEQVLGQIIEERVLLNYIDEKGYRVGDQALFDAIQSIAAFHQDGKFDKELYRNQLASQGYSPAQFEQELRHSTAMGQLNKALQASAFTVPARVARMQELKNQARKLRILTVVNDTDSVEVTEQEINDFYNEQSSRYMSPARVKVDYIEVSLDRVKQNISVDDDRLRERYEQMKDQLTSAEVREASHILITVASDASDDEIEKTRQTAADLKARIVDGEDFAELAKAHSQDPGSAAEGGDLGEVERGMMVKPFEDALFDMQPGQVSDPVKTRFGWHLIKLTNVSGGQTQTFDEARSRLESELKAELAETRIYDLVENLSNIGYEQPDSLLPAAEKLGLKIQTSDWFTRSRGEGLASQEKFRATAFSDDVLNNNRNSETIELSANQVVIMHLNQHEPSKLQPLESVKEAVIQALKIKKGREIAQSRGQELLQAIQQGQTMDTVAADAGLPIFNADFIERTSSVVDPEVASAAFSMPRPEDGTPLFEAVTIANGDYSIIELSDVQIKENDATRSEATELAKALAESNASYEFQALVQSLTEEASVVRTPVAELVQ